MYFSLSSAVYSLLILLINAWMTTPGLMLTQAKQPPPGLDREHDVAKPDRAVLDGLCTEEFLRALPARLAPYCERLPNGRESHGVDLKRWEEAKSEAIEWISRVIKPDVLPPDVGSRLMGLPAGIAGNDTIQAEWTTASYQLRVTQNRWRIVVTAKTLSSADDGKPRTPSEIELFARASLGKLICHAEPILHLSKQVTDTACGIRMDSPPTTGYLSRAEESRLARTLHGLDPSMPLPKAIKGSGIPGSYWWGTAHVHTDGNVVVFATLKGLGGQLESADEVLWFRTGTPPPARSKRAQPDANVPPEDGP